MIYHPRGILTMRRKKLENFIHLGSHNSLYKLNTRYMYLIEQDLTSLLSFTVFRTPIASEKKVSIQLMVTEWRRDMTWYNVTQHNTPLAFFFLHTMPLTRRSAGTAAKEPAAVKKPPTKKKEWNQANLILIITTGCWACKPTCSAGIGPTTMKTATSKKKDCPLETMIEQDENMVLGQSESEGEERIVYDKKDSVS